jgi:hypothetical protein
MTAAAAPALLGELRSRPPRAGRRQHRARPGGDGLTLERKLAGVWEGLLAAGAAECPVCAGTMTRSGAAGDCSSCGSSLG